MMEKEEQATGEVDIEAIMQDIRKQILSKKRIGKAALPLGGKRFSPAFYEQIYQASLLESEFGVTMHVTKSSVPLLGSLIDKLRAQFHQLVLFYVDQLVSQQTAINDHLLQAISLLSQELEDEVQEEAADREEATDF